MASSTQIREWWADWRCDTGRMVRVAFPGVDRDWNLLVADASAQLWEDFVDVMNTHDYQFRESAGGTYNCRKIRGTDRWSLHAYGVALDLNPSVNSYGQPNHDFPDGFIDDVLAIKLDGVSVFSWGGVWNTPDPMHWQVNVPPPVIDEGVDVKEIYARKQAAYIRAGYDLGAYAPYLPADDPDSLPGADGVWGSASRAAEDKFMADARQVAQLPAEEVVRLIR